MTAGCDAPGMSMRHGPGGAVLASVLVLAGCSLVPPALRPIELVVASPGEIGDVVGSVDPAVVPPFKTVTASFYVPPSAAWAVFADGAELMGSVDVGPRRGELPMGIELEANGSSGWWCRGDCP